MAQQIEMPENGFLAEHFARLKETGMAETVVFNGEPRVIVQDAEAYEKMLEELDRLETVEAVRRGVEAHRGGAPGVPAEIVFAKMRAIIEGGR